MAAHLHGCSGDGGHDEGPLRRRIVLRQLEITLRNLQQPNETTSLNRKPDSSNHSTSNIAVWS